jgi:predicted Zn-dependent protease
VPRAERIFGALAHVRPDRAFAHVGPAMALLNAGRAAEAAQRLQRALPQLAPGEDADTVSALCALALQLEGRTSESTRLLRELLHNAPPDADNDGLRLARRMLGEPQAPASHAPLSP